MTKTAALTVLSLALLILLCPVGEAMAKDYEDEFVSFSYPDGAIVTPYPKVRGYAITIGESTVMNFAIQDETASPKDLRKLAEEAAAYFKLPPEKRPENRAMTVLSVSDVEEVKTEHGRFYVITVQVQSPDGYKSVEVRGFGSVNRRKAFLDFGSTDAAMVPESYLGLLKSLRSKK